MAKKKIDGDLEVTGNVIDDEGEAKYTKLYRHTITLESGATLTINSTTSSPYTIQTLAQDFRNGFTGTYFHSGDGESGFILCALYFVGTNSLEIMVYINVDNEIVSKNNQVIVTDTVTPL